MRRGRVRDALLVVALLGCTLANAESGMQPAGDSLSRAYAVLHSKGFLTPPQEKTAPTPTRAVAASATPVAPRPLATDEAATAPARYTEEKIAPHAYQVLRSLGLLTVTRQESAQPLVLKRTVDRVVVEKSKRKMYLIKNGQSIREFTVWLGKMPNGPKREAGDLRTPEGVYTLDWRNSRSRFYKAIHISYPSHTDAEMASRRGVDPGGMIMIHGEHYNPAFRALYRRARYADWTDGCIAMRNDEMDEVWRTVADGTPIEIRP